MNKTLELYNFIKEGLADTGFITIKELDQECVNANTLEDLLFYHTGWHDLDQAQEALDAGEFYSNM